MGNNYLPNNTKQIDVYDKNKAFKEEKFELDRIEQTIDNIIKIIPDNVAKLYEEAKSFGALDKYDQGDKANKLKSLHLEEERYRLYSESKSSPYFGHIIIDSSWGEESFFIGEKDISNNGDTLVCSWKSNIADAYYKNETKFEIKKNSYNLVLRRFAKINSAKLIDVLIFYDTRSNLSDIGIIDSFLISVLEEKRRNYLPTDIITSIQSEQNTIIRRPLSESFIIQGCAGCGKTMILMHRLAYLADKESPDTVLKWCILTPNKFMNTELSQLDKKLEISAIKRYTFEYYYALLIKRLGKNDYTELDDKTKKYKYGKVSENVLPEDKLPNALLSEIYSLEFRNIIIELYNQIWDIVIKYIKDNRILSILKDYGKPNIDISKYSFDTFSQLKTICSDVSTQMAKDIKDYPEFMTDIAINDKPEIMEDQSIAIRIEKTKEKLNKIRERNPSKLKLKNLAETLKLINSLDFEILFEKIENVLIELYQQHSIKYFKSQNYRHRLYVKLLLCSLYYNRNERFETFLSIDEAQDMAESEYKLIKNILGNSCIFNLYGDIYQSTLSYKGISDWSIYPYKQYVLDTNYRNTVQITRHCNDIFDMNVREVGLNGNIVKQCNIEETTRILLTLQNDDPNRRIVIICKYISSDINSLVHKTIPSKKLCVESFEKGKISLVTLNHIKGMEFEAVGVITDEMSDNEKYVSFTRAKNNLFITSAKAENI